MNPFRDHAACSRRRPASRGERQRRVDAKCEPDSLLDPGSVGSIEGCDLGRITLLGAPSVEQSLGRRATGVLDRTPECTAGIHNDSLEAGIRDPAARRVIFILDARDKATDENVVDREVIADQIVECRVPGLLLRFGEYPAAIGMDAPDGKGMVGVQDASGGLCGRSDGFPAGRAALSFSSLDDSSQESDLEKIEETKGKLTITERVLPTQHWGGLGLTLPLGVSLKPAADLPRRHASEASRVRDAVNAERCRNGVQRLLLSPDRSIGPLKLESPVSAPSASGGSR